MPLGQACLRPLPPVNTKPREPAGAKQAESFAQQALAATVKCRGAGFEGAHNPPHRFVEHHSDHLLQHEVAKLEINEELHLAAAALAVGELPPTFEVAKRAVEVFRIDTPRSRVQHHAAAELFAEQLERDHKVDQLHLAPVGQKNGGATATPTPTPTSTTTPTPTP